MPKFSANLSMLFTEVDFMQRFRRAKEQGFSAVEYMFPYDYPIAALRSELEAHRLSQVLFNLPAGDWAAGERGIACLPGREAGVPRRRRARDRVCAGAGLRSHQLSDRQSGSRRRPPRHRRTGERESELRRRRSGAAEYPSADRTDQPLRHAAVLPANLPAGDRTDRGDRQPQPVSAVRPLPHAAHGGRADADPLSACWRRSTTFRSPTIRGGTSRAPVKSTASLSSRSWIAWVIAAGSAVNTNRSAPRRAACHGLKKYLS